MASIRKEIAKQPPIFWIVFYILVLLITLPVLAYVGVISRGAPGTLTVTINQKTGTADPNPSYTSLFEVVFSEAIDESTFTTTDISTAGTAAGQVVQSISETGTYNKTTYDVRISATSAGTITPTIAQELVASQANPSNTNNTSTSIDNSVAYDGTYLPGEFIMTYETTALNTAVTISVKFGLTYNYDVDWDNDGVYDSTGQTTSATNDYGGVGTHTVRVRGTFPAIENNASFSTTNTVEQWGTNEWATMENAFQSSEDLVIEALDSPDLSSVTSMGYMFQASTNFNSDISAWNVSNVTNMTGTFSSASAFNQPLNNWDVSNVTDMRGMFSSAAAFNQPLSNWDVSNVTDMSLMFNEAAAFNQPLNNWEVNSVQQMNAMFQQSAFNQPLSNWDVSSVLDTSGMFFQNTVFNQSLNDWTTTSLTSTNQMFYGASAFNQPLNSWDVSGVYDMTLMFTSSAFNHPLNSWDVSSAQSMVGMFGLTSFNQPLNNWNTASVTTMQNMFFGNTAFDQSLASFDMEDVVSVADMFGNGAGLSTTNYDATIKGWGAQTLKSGLTFEAGTSKYCSSVAERQAIIANFSWIINDGGEDCSSLPAPNPETPTSTPSYPTNPTEPTAPTSPTSPAEPPVEPAPTETTQNNENQTFGQSVQQPNAVFAVAQGNSVWGRTVSIAENVPKPVAKSVPYILILFLFLIALFYAYQTYLEVNSYKIRKALLSRLQNLQVARDNFIQLTSHHINTPIALLGVSAEVLSNSKSLSATTEQRLNDLLGKLKNSMKSLLANTQNVQEPNKAIVDSIQKYTIGNPYFNMRIIGPTLVVAVLVIFSNILFEAADRYNITFYNIAWQTGLFIAALITLGLSYRTLQVKRAVNKEIQQVAEIEQQLDSKRLSFIDETSLMLDNEVAQLEKITKELPQSNNKQKFSVGLAQLKTIAYKFSLFKRFSMSMNSGEFINLTQTTNEIVESYQTRANEAKVKLEYNISDIVSHSISVDAYRYLLISLIDNAIKFNKPGGTVTVELSDSKEYAQIKVKDTGKGISKEMQDKMFEPFNRASSATTYDFDGIGFDIYLDKVIVESQGGSMKISSEVNEGTEVTIDLPRTSTA